MRNYKGEIATFLTLGLVLVGAVVTLASSYFTNQQKNMATASRAANSPIPCSTVKSTYTKGSYYSCNGKYYKLSTCANEITEGVGNYCKALNPSTPVPAPATDGTLAACEYTDTLAVAECGSAANTTSTGCGKNSKNQQTYKCKTDVAASVESSFICAIGEKKSGTSSQTCSVICGTAGYISNTQQLDGTTRNCCCNKSAESVAPVASGSSSYQCSEGEPVLANGTCFSTCEANGSTYVSNSQGPGADGKNYCCCKKTESGKGFDTCYKAFTPGLYGCEAPSSKVVIYAPSMAAVGMTNCSKYNTNSNTSLYFAQAPGAYSDGQCAVVWSGALDVGAKNQEAQQLIEPPPAPVEEEIPPGDKCENMGSSLICRGSCESPNVCKASQGKTDKKWCCQSDGSGISDLLDTSLCKVEVSTCKNMVQVGGDTRISYYKSSNPLCSGKCYGIYSSGVPSTRCDTHTWEELKNLKLSDCQKEPQGNGGISIIKTKYNCPAGSKNQFFFQGSDGLYYSDLDDATGDFNNNTICGRDGPAGNVQPQCVGETKTCSDYCGKNKWPYSNKNTYIMKDKYERNPLTCEVIGSVYNYCGCSMQKQDGLFVSDIVTTGFNPAGEDVKYYNCKVLGYHSNKSKATENCSTCGWGWFYGDKPNCIISRTDDSNENKKFQISCCQNQL